MNGLILHPVEIKFDKSLENILQSNSYPDFTGDTVFTSAPILTKFDLFAWNKTAIKKVKSVLEAHFRRQAEKGQPQYKIFHVGPITSYRGESRGKVTLKNLHSNDFDEFKNPEFEVKARRQTSAAEELTCNADISERNDLIYYISMGFTYNSLSLNSEFGIDESPTDGQLTVTFTDLSVKIFLQVKEIDNTGNFRCATPDSIFPRGYTHRAPEFTIKYNLNACEIAVTQYPTSTSHQEVDELLDYVKYEILANKEAVERRIWAYLLPNFTKYVMMMANVKNIAEILYYVVQNNANPSFSFTQSNQRRDDDFLSFT